jgi:hypothetical protein
LKFLFFCFVDVLKVNDENSRIRIRIRTKIHGSAIPQLCVLTYITRVHRMDVRSPQQYCLRWNNHLPNLGSVFAALLQREVLVDVTLTSEGRSIKCHKVDIQAFYLVTNKAFTLFASRHQLSMSTFLKFFWSCNNVKS